MNNGEFYLADAIEVIEEVLASGGEFRMFPKGTSMLPLIVQTRDSVVLKRNTEEGAKKHDIAFYRRKNGQFVLHRVMRSENGVYAMCGDNQAFLEEGVTHDRVIGKVCRMTIDGKTVEMTDPRYLRYVKRRRNLFLRRVSLFISRRNPFNKK